MKFALKALFGILATLVAIVLIAPYFIDLNSYKSQIISTAEETSGLRMSVDGDLTLSILPSPSFSVSDVKIAQNADALNDPVISFKRLNVNVELIPLFSGNVAVKSVSIDEPVVKVEKSKDGSINLSDLVKGNMNDEVTDNINSPPRDEKSKNTLPNISFNVVRIKDGTVIYKDAATNEEKTIRNMNFEVSAQNLTGPYNADGSLFYDGYAIDFDVETDKYNVDEKVISPKVMLKIEPIGLDINFTGAVNMQGATPALQGHVELKLKDLSKFTQMKSTQKPLIVTGVLSANSTSLSLSNMKGALGENKLTGSASLDLKTLTPNITLKTTNKINLSDFGLNSLPYKTVSFDLKASGNETAVKFDKTTLVLDGDTYVMSGKYVFPSSKASQRLDLDIKTTSINLDSLMGYTGAKAVNGNAAPSQSGGMGLSTASISTASPMPFDTNISFSADKALFREKNASNVSLTLTSSGNKIDIKDLSVGDYIGTSLKASGSTKNLNTLDDINAYLEVNSKSAKALLTHMGVDTSALPKAADSGTVKLKASGSKNTLDLTANISALGGELISKGSVASVMNAPSIKNLIIQLKHKNMANLLNLLTGSKINDANLSKPMDIYTEINQTGKVYELSKLKGDFSGAAVQGHLKVDMSGKTPSIDGALDFGELKMQSIVDAKGGAYASGGAPSSSGTPKAAASSRWSKDTINASALHSVNLDLDLKAQKIQYGTWPLQNPSVKLVIKNGNLAISGLNAGVFGGSMRMDANVQSVAQERQPVHFDSKSKFENVDIGALATSLIGTKLVKISGRGDLNLNLKSSGASSAALVHDLSGDGSVNAQNIILDGVDVVRFVRALSDDSKPGDTVLGLWKGTTKGGQTQFDTLDGLFTIKQGIVNIAKMDLDGARAAIETRGNINLPDWTLATKHKLIAKGSEDVPSDVPPFEITFNGSLDNPAQTFGQGLLQDYLNRKLQRKFNQLLSDKLGLPSNDNTPQKNTNNGEQGGKPAEQKQPNLEDAAEEAIKGILGDLLR